MHRYKSLTVIGTSHISPESAEEIEAFIEAERPDIVALELDGGRLSALLSGERKIRIRDIGALGFNGWLFALIGQYAGRKLGDIVGVRPGSEMLKAYEAARRNGCRIALIDQKIEITLRKISKRVSSREKWRFVLDIVKAPFSRKKVEFDLRKVPGKEVINRMMNELGKRYPNVYDVLVLERNRHMAKNLYKLMQDNKVAAVVGAGHEEGLIKEVKCLEEKN